MIILYCLLTTLNTNQIPLNKQLCRFCHFVGFRFLTLQISFHFAGFRFLTLQILFHFIGFRFLTLQISLDFVFVSFLSTLQILGGQNIFL